MSRIIRNLIIAAVALVLSAPAWAGESEDIQQIRSLFKKVWADGTNGDPTSAIAFCAPDVVYYVAFGGGPELWSVAIVGQESFRKLADSETQKEACNWAKHPAWSHGEEVLHVNIKDARAIVLTQKWGGQPDSTAREDIRTKYQEVVMLAKMNGEWKITNGIVGVNYEQKVIKWDPK